MLVSATQQGAEGLAKIDRKGAINVEEQEEAQIACLSEKEICSAEDP
jgi:hypothetical protein